MIYPYCKHTEDKVVDSRSSGTGHPPSPGMPGCGRRFTTYEYIEKWFRSPSSSAIRAGCRSNVKKLLAGNFHGVQKRPVSRQRIEEMINSIENTLMQFGPQEVRHDQIGNQRMEELRKTDPVACVPSASVYREFKGSGRVCRPGAGT